jgi:hypothetical protein
MGPVYPIPAVRHAATRGARRAEATWSGWTAHSARPDPAPVATAVALRAVLPGLDALTGAERALLGEWLDRIAAGPR